MQFQRDDSNFVYDKCISFFCMSCLFTSENQGENELDTDFLAPKRYF